ncbi:MAG: MarR family winged helix-turn-helix transcriptional regulator [Sphingomonadales bacterium]
MNKPLGSDEMNAVEQVIDLCACGNLRRATRIVTRRYDDAFRGTGLRSTQLTILMHIAKQEEGAILSDLSRAMAMDASTLTRNLTPLEKAGYVFAEKTPAGRRRSVRLTEKGEEVLRDAMPLWEEAQTDIVGMIGKENFDRLRKDLNRLDS